MKNFQKLNMAVLLAFLLALCAGCSDDTASITEAPPSEEETNLSSALTDVKYYGNTAVLGLDETPEIVKACQLLFPNRQTSVTSETTLLIIPSGCQYEQEVEKVKEQGGVVAVINPSENLLLSAEDNHGYYAEIYNPNLDEVCIDNEQEVEEAKGHTELFDNIDWNTEVEEETTENDGTGDVFQDFDAVDPELGDNDIYTRLAGWVKDLNDYRQVKQSNANDEENLDRYFKSFHYSRTYPYDCTVKVRKLALSKPDIIKGNGSITVSFDIFQVHCYEGQPGAGDYYIVEMSACVNNKDMYKGKWWNRHGGSYVRICGLYGKSFSVECIPCRYTFTQKGGKRNYEDLSNDVISFTAAGTPSPQTTIGQVSYTSSHTKGVDAGISVSGGKDAKGGHGDVQGSIAGNWSWTNSKSYSISDMDIKSTLQQNRVGYQLVFNNLPKFDWSKERGFDEGYSQIYRSTAEIHSSWAWYMPDIKDDSSDNPIAIRIVAQPVYGSLSFISTKADLKEGTYNNIVNVDDVIELKSFTRDRCTPLTFKNNLNGSVSIAKISIYKENETQACWEYTSTLVNGKSVTTPALKVANNYRVEFATSNGTTYKYKKNGGLLKLQWNLSDFNGNKVYAKDDFTNE